MSLNAFALEVLNATAGNEAGSREYHDLDAFFGNWVNDAAVTRALRSQRPIDEEMWE